jgi:hypothetical protein
LDIRAIRVTLPVQNPKSVILSKAKRSRRTAVKFFSPSLFRNPQHGVRGRRRVDRKGRVVTRPSDLEIASQSEIPIRAIRVIRG